MLLELDRGPLGPVKEMIVRVILPFIQNANTSAYKLHGKLWGNSKFTWEFGQQSHLGPPYTSTFFHPVYYTPLMVPVTLLSQFFQFFMCVGL